MLEKAQQMNRPMIKDKKVNCPLANFKKPRLRKINKGKEAKQNKKGI